MNPETYANELNEAFTAFQTSKNLPDNFCKFVASLESVPAESLTPELMNEVKLYFQDINERIQQYDEQYQILLNELGTLCGANQQGTPVHERFFKSLLDFLKLAYSIYQEEPEKLQVFYPLVQQLHALWQTGSTQLEGDLLQKALLLQLTKSAWVLSNPKMSMESTAKQIGGARKNKTRKQRHT